MNAALSVFHMLDYVWVSYGPNANHPDPGKVFNQQSKSALAQYLVDNECTDFALIQDAANAHKHMKITQQPTRVITSAGDTWRQSSGPGISMYIVPVMVIGQRGGTQVDFAPALQNVVTMWEDLIKRFNL